MPEVFISYARPTEDEARRVAEALKALGFEVWLDDELLPHRPYAEVLEEQLNQAKAVVVLWSQKALRSQWVRSEANHARAASKLVQASLDGTAPPMPFDQIQYAKLQGWAGDPQAPEWRKIVRSVRDLIERAPAASETGSDPDDELGRLARPPLMRQRSLRSVPAAALAAILFLAALAGGGVWFMLQRAGAVRPTAETPFEVLPFKAATADPASKALAAVGDSDVAGALEQGGVRVVSTPGGRGPRFVVDGMVDGDGARLHARVRLSEPRSDAIIWTADFAAPASDAPRLRAEISARASNVARLTQDALSCRSNDLDVSALALMVRGRDAVSSGNWNSLAAAQALVRRSPNYAPGHAFFAEILLRSAAGAGTNEQAALFRTQAVAEAQRARSLRPDCHSWEAPLMLATDFHQWREREQLVSEGPGKDEGEVQWARGWLLLQSGRTVAAVQLLQQAAEGQSPIATFASYIRGIHVQGKPEMALSTARELLATRPNDLYLQQTRAELMALAGDPDEALALLSDPMVGPAKIGPRSRASLVSFAQWRKNKGPIEREAAIQNALNERIPASWAVSMLASLGALDQAFARADAYAADRSTTYAAQLFGTSFLFQTETAAMRQDPRFIPLVEKLGLLKYWREAKLAPDFCGYEPAPVCDALKF